MPSTERLPWRRRARPQPGGDPAPGRLVHRVGLAALTIGLLLPFLGKPFHVDDPVFLAIARRILQSPLDPYGFNFYWYDTAEPMWRITANPPGLGYILAPLIAVLGEREVGLHAAFLVFPLVAVLSAYEIARRFTPFPLGAALLFAVAPMFVVSATTLMADLPALACVLAAVALHLRAVEGRRRNAILAGVVAAAAVLIKYTAVFVIPLLALGALLRDKRPLRHAPSVLLPLGALLLWEGFNLHTVGASHVLHAAGISRAVQPPWTEMILVTASFLFLGMGAAPVLLVSRLGRRDGWIALGAGLPAGIALVVLYRAGNSAFAGWGPLPVVTALAAAGGLAWIGLAVRDGLSRNRGALFLLAWFLGCLIQVIFFGSFVAARYLLPALLPAILLVSHGGRRATAIGASMAAVLSLTVASADLELARAYRRAAAQLHANYRAPGAELRFQGHWGFQYYLERDGHRPLYEGEAKELSVGDVIAIPRFHANVSSRLGVLRRWDGKRVVPAGRIYLMGKVPATVQHEETGAGFYSSRHKPLPFSWGAEVLEEIETLEIVATPGT